MLEVHVGAVPVEAEAQIQQAQQGDRGTERQRAAPRQAGHRRPAGKSDAHQTGSGDGEDHQRGHDGATGADERPERQRMDDVSPPQLRRVERRVCGGEIAGRHERGQLLSPEGAAGGDDRRLIPQPSRRGDVVVQQQLAARGGEDLLQAGQPRRVVDQQHVIATRA